MGSGIAQVCAAAGYQTIVREVQQGVLDKGMARIDKFLSDGVEKGKVTAAARDATLANLSGTTTFDGLAGCDLIIEAIVENADEKAGGLRRARRGRAATAPIFCSNTSSLCIQELASRTKRPDRFAGLHFFNPVPLMKLVEVVRGADHQRRDLSDGLRLRAVARARSRSRRRTSRASSSIACWSRTCSTPSARSSTGSARSKTSTRG